MNETGCKCPFYIGGKCTDEGDYVNRHTGKAVCFRDPDAIPREMFEEKNYIAADEDWAEEEQHDD